MIGQATGRGPRFPRFRALLTEPIHTTDHPLARPPERRSVGTPLIGKNSGRYDHTPISMLRALLVVVATLLLMWSAKPTHAADRVAIEIQELLNVLGYPVGKPDGIVGLRTAEAIRKFVEQQGLREGPDRKELLQALRTSARLQSSRSMIERDPKPDDTLAKIEFAVTPTYRPDDLASQLENVQVSADKRLIASANVYSNGIRIWDLEKGKFLRAIPGQAEIVKKIAFLPNNNIIAAMGPSLYLINTGTGEIEARFDGHRAYIWDFVVTKDGSRVYSGGFDGKIGVWDARTGKNIGYFPGNQTSVDCLVLDDTAGRLISVGRDDTVILWDVSSMKAIKTARFNSGSGCSGAEAHPVVAFATEAGVEIRSSPDLSLMKRLPYRSGESEFNKVRLLDDQRVLVTGDETRMYDVNTGRMLEAFGMGTILPTNRAGTEFLRIKPNGVVDFLKLEHGFSDVLKTTDLLANVTIPKAVVDERLATFLDTIKEGGSTLAFVFPKFGDGQFSSDAAFVEAREDGSFQIVQQASSLRALDQFSFDGRVEALFSADGHVMGIAKNGKAIVVDLVGGTSAQLAGYITSILFAADNSILSISDAGRLQKWRVTMESGSLSAEPVYSVPLDGLVRPSVSLTPNPDLVVAGSTNHKVLLLNVTTGAVATEFEFSEFSEQEPKLSADGRFLWSLGSVPQIWDAVTGRLLASHFAFSEDDWITITPEGFYDQGGDGATQLNIVRGSDVFSADQVYQSLFRPELVWKNLAGDPKAVASAAAQVDLKKIFRTGISPEVYISSTRFLGAEKVRLQVEVTDRGGGAGKMEWRINGTTLAVDEPKEGTVGRNSGAITTYLRDLTLMDESNRIEVVAYDSTGVIASNPAFVVLPGPLPNAGNPARLFVLAVGVNEYYDSRLRLNYSVEDARSISQAFSKAGSELYEDVFVTTLYDEDVTVSNLERAFSDLSKVVRAEDVFVFFVAGHGKTVEGRYYFIPADFRYTDERSIQTRGIGQDKFQAWLSGIQARKSLFMTDSCESGTLTEDSSPTRGMELVAAMERMTRAIGRTVLSASASDAPALEGYKGHGVFSYVLLDALGQADVNKDALIDITELAGYVDRQVPEVSFAAFQSRQIPQMRIIGSNFPLVSSIKVLASDVPGPDLRHLTPDHVIVSKAAVRQSPNSTSPVVLELDVGSRIILVEKVGDWASVARGRAVIGYVEASSLAKLQ